MTARNPSMRDRLRRTLLMTMLTFTSLDASALPAPDVAGIHDLELQLADRRRARFTLSLPAAMAGGTPGPLIMVLHYGGQPTRFYGRPLIEQLFEPALRELGAIFVAPESLGGQWHEAANEAFVMQLIEALSAAYPVDPQKIAVAGYSMGAIGCWYFIEHYPERFVAAIPVAGLPASSGSSAVPVFLLATPSDEIFPFERFQSRVTELRAAGSVVQFTSVEANGHYDIGAFSTPLRAAVSWLRGIVATR